MADLRLLTRQREIQRRLMRETLDPAELDAVAAAPAPPGIYFRVKSVADDYLTCRLILPDGSDGSVDIYVARNWDVQLTPQVGVNKLGDGTTRTKVDSQTLTVTQGSTSETWKVNPKYWTPSGAFKGATILAVRTRQPAEGITGGDGNKIVWQEISPRAWAKV